MEGSPFAFITPMYARNTSLSGTDDLREADIRPVGAMPRAVPSDHIRKC